MTEKSGEQSVSIGSAGRRVVNRILKPAGFVLVRLPHSDRDSQPISKVMIDRLVVESTPAIQQVIQFFAGSSNATQAGSWIREFMDRYFSAKFAQSSGGSGFNSAMILFVASKALNPDVILESGTFQGGGTWALRQGAPDAEMHCYDLSFENLEYRDPHANYHKYDWAARSLTTKLTEKSLGFFDDHVSQGTRIVEAAERGLKWLIFDDNVSWHTLHRDGLPPVPTVDMIHDVTLPNDSKLAWISSGRHMNYQPIATSIASVRMLISRYIRSPIFTTKPGTHPRPSHWFESSEGAGSCARASDRHQESQRGFPAGGKS